jgi:hypothetical protein
VLALLMVLSVPVWHCLRWGQISLPLTALAMWGGASANTRLGDWLLGSAVALKGYPVLLLAPVLGGGAAWRRVLRVGVASCLLGLAIPALLLGWSRTTAWLGAAVGVLADANEWMTLNSNAQYIPHVARRLIGGPGLMWVALCVAGGAWAMLEAARAFREGRRDRGLAIAWLTVPLLVPPAWVHYFVFLPWALAVGFVGRATAETRERVLWAFAAGLSSATGLVIAGTWEVYAHLGLLALADLALLGAFLGTRRPAHEASSLSANPAT